MNLGWDSYLIAIDGRPASVVVDLDQPDTQVVSACPFLLWVQIRLNEVNEHGLPTQAEYERIGRLEDALDREYESLGGRHVGGYSHDGARNHFVYVAKESPDVQPIGAVIRAHGYEPAIWSEPDAGWPRYFEWLYPNKLDLRRILDGRVIRRLEELGDSLLAERDVSHVLYFPSGEARTAFLEELGGAGWRSKLLEHSPGEGGLGVEVTTRHAATLAVVAPVVADLLIRAERVGGEYDGWETLVVKPQ